MLSQSDGTKENEKENEGKKKVIEYS